MKANAIHKVQTQSREMTTKLTVPRTQYELFATMAAKTVV